MSEFNDKVFSKNTLKINSILEESKNLNEIVWRFRHRIDMILISIEELLIFFLSEKISDLFMNDEHLLKNTVIATTMIFSAMIFFIKGENYKSLKYNYLHFVRKIRDKDDKEIIDKLIKQFRKSEKFEGYCAEQGIYLAIRDIYGKNSPEMKKFKKLRKKYSRNIIPNF